MLYMTAAACLRMHLHELYIIAQINSSVSADVCCAELTARAAQRSNSQDMDDDSQYEIQLGKNLFVQYASNYKLNKQ